MSDRPASIPITVRGRYLWRGDERFFVRGVSYQIPSMQDPICDARLPQLRHDISLFKELGLNTLFVYFVDDTKRHGQAMKLLEEAGIYVFTGISTRFSTINRLDPYGSYHSTAVSEFFTTVNVMAQYPNTLGVLAGNSITNSPRTRGAAPVIKAVVRDLKKYMKIQHAASGQRILPIGYSAAAVDLLDMTLLKYLSLGRSTSCIDFWACNCYMWAGESNLQMSGYESLLNRLQDAAIPIFMSGYGANIPNPRLFQETLALYSPQMSRVFSGGCAYTFWEAMNSYGLVDLVDQEHAPSASAEAIEQRHQSALTKADNPRKTAEKRRTDRGILAIFHDFVRYKENLEATRGIDTAWEGNIMEHEAAERGNVDTTQMSWPWEPEAQLPDTIVVEALTKNVKEGHIREIFGKFGTIKDLRMPMNPVFNINRGTAYILYAEIDEAERAIAKMHEAQLDGAKIQVSIVLPRRRFSQTPPPRRGGPHPRFQDDYYNNSNNNMPLPGPAAISTHPTTDRVQEAV
ncbi:hypothetical protein E8E13_005309 [Curvularia kusanoi]|uniref:1,3-beta-glucanosyltransferase n=1 Tax=Curvularia kusanoi TaxID=90978 RepID=A0A9P4W415_CURKU|nr:hypothetical protein E8E13_005309 [Curvularia kusanoi]